MINTKQWKIWQRGRGLSERTIRERAWTVERIAREFDTEPQNLTPDQVAQWFAQPMHPATRASYHGHIRAWGRWVALHGGNDASIQLGPVKKLRTKPRPVTSDHLEAALRHPELRRRTRMMMLLAAYQGLRVHEIAKIRGEDVDVLNKTVHVLGKGQVEEWLPLHPIIEAEASGWPSKGYWFHSYTKPGHHIRSSQVGHAISGALTRAGANATAHQLRHWFATELVRSGADVFTTQTLMRHASAATTAVYVQVADDSGREAIQGLPTFDITQTAA
ncbi:MAG: site-specific integrase [Candidatus Nanopelagicales bacterium]